MLPSVDNPFLLTSRCQALSSTRIFLVGDSDPWGKGGLELVNIPGNPRVKISDPYPYPAKPGPPVKGSGFRRVRVKGFRVSRVRREPGNPETRCTTLHYTRILGLKTRNRLEPPSLAAALPAFVGQRWPAYAVVGHHWSSSKHDYSTLSSGDAQGSSKGR